MDGQVWKQKTVILEHPRGPFKSRQMTSWSIDPQATEREFKVTFPKAGDGSGVGQAWLRGLCWQEAPPGHRSVLSTPDLVLASGLQDTRRSPATDLSSSLRPKSKPEGIRRVWIRSSPGLFNLESEIGMEVELAAGWGGPLKRIKM